MILLKRLKAWARQIKRDVVALWLAARDPGVLWYAKALCAVVAAYALSPIDLIPDFIPIVGYLDEAVLLPLAMLVAVRMIPPDVMAELRARADLVVAKPVSRIAAAVVVLIWVGTALTGAWMLYG